VIEGEEKKNLREWASLIWGFAVPIFDKQAEVMIPKLSWLEGQLFKIILKSTIILYYATYANTDLKKNL
tara:strand:+ start:135 stop:341 length:207 start_codon:yes stop_codon:yes gene_type:complete